MVFFFFFWPLRPERDPHLSLPPSPLPSRSPHAQSLTSSYSEVSFSLGFSLGNLRFLLLLLARGSWFSWGPSAPCLRASRCCCCPAGVPVQARTQDRSWERPGGSGCLSAIRFLTHLQLIWSKVLTPASGGPCSNTAGWPGPTLGASDSAVWCPPHPGECAFSYAFPDNADALVWGPWSGSCCSSLKALSK